MRISNFSVYNNEWSGRPAPFKLTCLQPFSRSGIASALRMTWVDR
jgi:hypothetical protein